MLHGRPQISRTGLPSEAHGQEEARSGLHRRLLPGQGQANGRSGRRHDHHQGHVGSHSAAPRSDAREAAQAESFDSGRFPHPLHPGLRPGFGAGSHRGRRGRRRHQLLVLRRGHGRSGARTRIRLLQETGHRPGRQHGSRGEDQRRTTWNPQGAEPVGIRHREARAEAVQPADRQTARRDRRTVRRSDPRRTGRR